MGPGRRLASFAVLLFGALAAWPSSARAEKVLRYAFEIAESGFDPALESDAYSSYVLEAIFDPPLSYDYLARPARLVPNTLEGMPEVSDGGATYTLHLKKGIRFTDDPAFQGKPRELTAEDYVYSVKRIVDPKNRSPIFFLLEGKIVGLDALRAEAAEKGRLDYDAKVSGLEVEDRYTLRIRLTRPDYTFLYVLATPSLGAVAREVVLANPGKTRHHPVGTGPFRLASYQPSSRIVLERNPGYREDHYQGEPEDTPEDRAIAKALKGKLLPRVDRIEVSIIDEQQPRWLGQAGFGVAVSAIRPESEEMPACRAGGGLRSSGGLRNSLFLSARAGRVREEAMSKHCTSLSSGIRSAGNSSTTPRWRLALRRCPVAPHPDPAAFRPMKSLKSAPSASRAKAPLDIKCCAGENIVALCDVDEKAAAGQRKKYPNAKFYRDSGARCWSRRSRSTAVTVSTPDHTHAIIAATAIRLGKHVYCQKPLTQTVYEARLLRRLAKEYKAATQMGDQGRRRGRPAPGGRSDPRPA